MYCSLRRHGRAGGACARDVPTEAHQGDHVDFLCRLQRAAHEASQGTSQERRQFAQRMPALIADVRNLRCAIDHLAQDETAPGPGGLQLERLSCWEQVQLARTLSAALRAGTYRPGPARRHLIPKASGSGTRPIEIFDARDKIVQRAVVQVLDPFLEPRFDRLSFGFRPRLGREHALITGELLAERENRWIWIIEDFRDAFTQIPHRRLLDVLQHVQLDEALRTLIQRMIGNSRNRGLSQGSCLSPLLVNVYLDHFLDSRWRARDSCTPLIRVADDLLLQAADAPQAEATYADLAQLVSPIGMPLKYGPARSIRHLNQGQHADWLGYRLWMRDGRLHVGIGSKSWNRLAEKVARVHAEPQAPLRARDAIAGWVGQLGACFEAEDRPAVYRRVLALAREQAFEELPSEAEFLGDWERAYVRFYHLRRVVWLPCQPGGGDGAPPDVQESGFNERSPRPREATGGQALRLRTGPCVTIYTDGSCLGSRGIGGWAFITLGPNPGDRLCRAESHPRTTNNRMELTAAIRGLESLPEPTRVHLVTDSEYVHRGIVSGLPRWKQSGWRNCSGPLANVSLWRELDALLQVHDVTSEWTRGHSGLSGNEDADRLAREAAQSLAAESAGDQGG